MCTATALMILTSGTYNVFDSATGEMLLAGAPQLGDNYVGYTQAAVDTVFTGFGSKFVGIALVFFVFTTIMTYYFYSESSIMYLTRGAAHPRLEKALVLVLRLMMIGATIFGALREANVVWQLGDIGVGVMAWINVIAILILGGKAFSALRDYEKEISAKRR